MHSIVDDVLIPVLEKVVTEGATPKMELMHAIMQGHIETVSQIKEQQTERMRTAGTRC